MNDQDTNSGDTNIYENSTKHFTSAGIQDGSTTVDQIRYNMNDINF